MNIPRYRVTRFVAREEVHNFAGRDVREGEVLYAATRPTYGCVNTRYGIALTHDQDGDYPFFEFPLDAVEPYDQAD